MPRHFHHRPLLLALSLAYAGLAVASDATVNAITSATTSATNDGDADAPIAVVNVSGTSEGNAYTARGTKSAGRLDLSLRETPQSVSVVTRALMDDFKLNDINAVLASTTGVTVERVETSRTYFTSRGFDIVNLQFDGVGTPLVFGNLQGDLDTALYERIDIVRGANGLTSSTGNPSATVNFIRKRPTAQTSASAALTLGSRNLRRAEADVSTKLNDSGSVAGRAVVVRQDSDSYLDRYAPKKTVGYAVVDAHLDSGTLLTVGHTYETNRQKGVMWGALPLYHTDGGATDYPVGTSTSADWSRWNTTTNSSFVELSHNIDRDWKVNATVNHVGYRSDSTLQYVYGTPDRATGDGLYAYPSQYNATQHQTLADLSVDGKIDLGGRRHELSFGYSWSKSRLSDESFYGRGIGTPLPGNTAFDGSYPMPLFDASYDGSRYDDRRSTVFAAARLNLADDWKLLAGINNTRARSSGNSYGVAKDRAATKSTPYVGVVYDITGDLSAYASHTEIFNPQSETDASGQTLAPVEGKTSEAGLKSALFGGKLNLAAAVFKTRQDNTAEQAGIVGAKAFYRGVNAKSQGVEFDMSGELAKGWQANAGISRLSIHGEDGQSARTYVPRTTAQVSTTYRVAALPALKVGANVRWQGDIHITPEPGIVVNQSSYALLGLMARYDIDKHLSLSVNVHNVTDKKYLTSLYWTQSLYGAPRAASATLAWNY